MANKRKKKTKLPKWTKNMPQWAVGLILGVAVAAAVFFGIEVLPSDGNGNAVDTFLTWLDQALYGESAPTTTPDGILQVDVIDVGQGESILITVGGKAVLIDAGENDKGDEVLDHLEARGIDHLDLAIGTHSHSDHIGGMDTVLSQIPADEFWMGATPDNLVQTTKTYYDVLEVLDINKIPLKEPEPGTEYDLGGAVLTVLGPVGTPESVNNCSLVCRIDYGEVSFLFNGDAEKSMEDNILRSGADVDADVMTMGHHGSSTSSSKAYFNAVSPEYAAISCGKDNEYGHPHKETITKLKNSGTTYRRTDVNGTITFTTDGTAIEMSTER